MKCRHCQSELTVSLIDLVTSPPSNAYLTQQELQATEKYFPLRVLVCTNCWLVQTEDYAGADELFLSDYAYFSSFSSSWLKHSEQYLANMVDRFDLDGQGITQPKPHTISIYHDARASYVDSILKILMLIPS